MTLLPSLLASIGSFPLPLAEFGPWGLGPILIPLAGISLALAGIIFGSLDKMQKRRLRHELLRVALEKGQPLPAELLDEPQARRHRDDRRSGLIALAVGVALYFFLGALATEPGVKWVALVPGAVGVALLFNWALERHADNGQKSP